MQNTTANYKLEINKPSREFECKITIGNNIYNNDELVNLTLEHTQPQEGFSIGDTISQSLDLTLLNRGDIIYSTSQIKVEIGLKIGSTIEYILMGIFNIDDIEKTDYTTKFTAYDNMIKFETPYFSSLGDKPTLKQVVNELSKITGIEFIGSLPNYTVSKLEGFTCREVLSYVASICGGNAVITRDGKFTIKSLSEIKKSIDGNNYFDYKREEVKYKIGKISCQIDENNILYKGSTGTDSMELGFENPWVTETILNDLYNRLNGLSYLGYSMKWQGDLSLDPYDIVTVTDIKNVIRKIPILSQKISYTGGLTSEIGAKGETKNKNSFSSSGSTVNKVNRAIIEQAIIKEALIEKANIKDVEAVSIRTQILEAKTAKIEEAIIDVAHISDLNTINANIQNLIANDVKINNALINKADITELNAVVGNINIINSELANIKTLVNGNLSSENIQAGGITSDKLTIANGFITNAMIANLDVSKINAGNISTNKFRIVSDNGGIEIVGATQQFKDKNNKVRIQMGQDAKGNFNFILRGEDGTTTLIDHTGIKEKAIADNLIKGNMVATDAIGEKQINYSSLITGLNKDTNTQLIKASKVEIDLAGQTLDLAFNSLKNQADNNKNIIENHSTNISAMQGQISTAINNTQIVKDGKTILLKDDYNRTISKVDSINSTIGTHTTKINELTGNIISVDTKVNSVQRDLEGTKSTVSSHTNLIDGLNSKLSTQGSSIEQLKNQITLKVNSTELNAAINKKANSTDVYTKTEVYTKTQTDSAIKIAKDEINLGVKNTYETKSNVENKISTAVDNIQIGGRNLISPAKVQAYTQYNTVKPNNTNGWTITKKETSSSVTIKQSDFTPEVGKTYTFSGYATVNGTPVSEGFFANNRLNTYLQPADRIVVNNGYFEVVQKWNTSSVWILHCALNGVTNGVIAEFTNLMLEEGNKASAYTKNPDDIDEVIGTKANTVDVYKKTEVYTRTETDSAIKVAKDEINLGVKNTYETKSNVESKISTATLSTLTSAKSYADTKKAESISTASTDATNKVNSAKTELNTAINKKANSTDVYTKTEVYTKSQTDSAIKIAKDEINLGVSNTYETKTNVENKISTAVDNIKIGGRNLITPEKVQAYSQYCTVTSNSKNGWTITKKEMSNKIAIKQKDFTPELGKTYVLSGYATVNGNPISANFFVDRRLNTYLGFADRIFIDNGYFEVVQCWHVASAWILHCELLGVTNGVIVEFSNLMLEEGTKASAYTKNPDYLESKVDSKANSADVYKKSETYTRSETDSKINVAKDQINLSVSGTYETKTNVESKINTAKANAINSAKSYTDGQITTVNKTITNKVAEIKATTDSISQKVSTTESKITTINNNISGLTNRVSTAESKLTSTSLTTTISSAITAGTSSISTTQFVMDKNGLTIKNGALTIKNKAGTTVLNSDTDGNLLLTGTIKSQSGERYVSLNSGGITFNDYHKNEQMLRIAISYFTANRDINGVTFAMPSYSDFIRFSHISKTDITNGWSSTDTQYQFFDLWSGDQNINGSAMKKGMTVYSPLYIKNKATFSNTIELLNDGTPHQITLRTSASDGLANAIGIYGNDGVDIGYRSGTSNYSRIRIVESSFAGTDDQIKSWGNWNMCGYTLHNVKLANYSGYSLTANPVTRTSLYTSPVEMDGDKGKYLYTNVQLKNGKAILSIPRSLKGLITGYEISCIVKKGRGDIWIEEELENRFTIMGTEDIKVNIEITYEFNMKLDTFNQSIESAPVAVLNK